MNRPEPFGKVLHRESRFVRKASPVLHRQVRASDLVANQLRRQSIEPSLGEYVWLIGGAILGVVVVLTVLL